VFPQITLEYIFFECDINMIYELQNMAMFIKYDKQIPVNEYKVEKSKNEKPVSIEEMNKLLKHDRKKGWIKK
jgi:hypothetical protein